MPKKKKNITKLYHTTWEKVEDMIVDALDNRYLSGYENALKAITEHLGTTYEFSRAEMALIKQNNKKLLKKALIQWTHMSGTYVSVH